MLGLHASGLHLGADTKSMQTPVPSPACPGLLSGSVKSTNGEVPSGTEVAASRRSWPGS